MSSSRREELLDACLQHVADTGFSDFSLRSVAAAVGTSHRMLSHHFGSKDGLERAIIERIRDLLTAPLQETESQAQNLTARQLIEGTWNAMTNPASLPILRLYFDLSSKAMHGNRIAKEAVEAIRAHSAETARASYPQREEGELLASAAMTSTFLKGLLYDHLSGGTLADAEVALERFIQLIEIEAP